MNLAELRRQAVVNRGTVPVRTVLWGLWWLGLFFAVVVGGWFIWGMISFASSDDPLGTISKVPRSTVKKWLATSFPGGERPA